MQVAALSLTNFRNYPELTLEFSSGINTLIGPNGQGKTNVVEAIGYLATLMSHRVATDAPLVRRGEQRASIAARVSYATGSERTVQVDINIGQANKGKVNGVPVTRMAELLGTVRAVIFAPEDLALVKGDPATRRAFLNEITIQRRPRLNAVLSDYDKVLRQRSSLLKSAGSLRGSARERALDSLFVWDERLAALGGRIRAERVHLVTELEPHLRELYAQVSASSSQVRATYHGEGLNEQLTTAEDFAAEMMSAMATVRSKEVERGVCLIGPHRDDLDLELGDGPAKGYASHGESWSIALALRLAEARLLAEDGDDAILILDDVFAELDVGRRRRLVELLGSAPQVFVTAAVPDDVPAELTGATYHVSNGTVERV